MADGISPAPLPRPGIPSIFYCDTNLAGMGDLAPWTYFLDGETGQRRETAQVSGLYAYGFIL